MSEKIELKQALIKVIMDQNPDPFYTRIFEAIIEAVRDDDDQTSNRISMAIETVEERARGQAYEWGFDAGYKQAETDFNAK